MFQDLQVFTNFAIFFHSCSCGTVSNSKLILHFFSVIEHAKIYYFCKFFRYYKEIIDYRSKNYNILVVLEQTNFNHFHEDSIVSSRLWFVLYFFERDQSTNISQYKPLRSLLLINSPTYLFRFKFSSPPCHQRAKSSTLKVAAFRSSWISGFTVLGIILLPLVAISRLLISEAFRFYCCSKSKKPNEVQTIRSKIELS